MRRESDLRAYLDDEAVAATDQAIEPPVERQRQWNTRPCGVFAICCLALLLGALAYQAVATFAP